MKNNLDRAGSYFTITSAFAVTCQFSGVGHSTVALWKKSNQFSHNYESIYSISCSYSLMQL